MPFPMKLDGEEEKREGGGREKRDNKFSYIKGCHSKNISHTSLLPASCSPVSYNVQNREKGHECQCLPRQTEGHLFWQSLSKSYKLLKYLRRLGDEG